MANTKREKLFTEFPPVPTEKWEEVITADLKGADYERKLVWRTGEGFNVRPYYRAENLEGIRFLGSQAGEFPYVRGTRSHNRWRVHQTVEVKCPREANAEALKLLNSGVDSLGFSIAKEGFTAEELDQLLAGISIPAIEMVFCGAQTGSIAELVIAKLEKEGTASEAHVAFSIDPLVKGLSQKGDFCSPNGEKCFAKIASLIEKTREYKHIRIVTVSAGIFSNAGSTIVAELAFACASRSRSPRTTSSKSPSSARRACCGPTSSRVTTPRRTAPAKCTSTPARQTGTRPFTIPMSICSAARRRPCRPPSPAYIRWR